MLGLVPSAGVDVGQACLEVVFFPPAKPMRVATPQGGIDKIVLAFRSKGTSQVVSEAIGSYARKLVRGLVEAGFSVFVVNPRRIKAFRVLRGDSAKTDRLDAPRSSRALLTR